MKQMLYKSKNIKKFKRYNIIEKIVATRFNLQFRLK